MKVSRNVTLDEKRSWDWTGRDKEQYVFYLIETDRKDVEEDSVAPVTPLRSASPTQFRPTSPTEDSSIKTRPQGKRSLEEIYDDMFDDFKKEMAKEFEMTKISSMSYYLGFEVKQRYDGIFISQEAYGKEVLRKFNMENRNQSLSPSRRKRSCRDTVHRCVEQAPSLLALLSIGNFFLRLLHERIDHLQCPHTCLPIAVGRIPLAAFVLLKERNHLTFVREIPPVMQTCEVEASSSSPPPMSLVVTSVTPLVTSFVLLLPFVMAGRPSSPLCSSLVVLGEPIFDLPSPPSLASSCLRDLDRLPCLKYSNLSAMAMEEAKL
ncbi:hypothetical protein RJ639_004730 [Escallonia herrerae]|uniref:Reverse transcriptase Ty1/copia-type domain-containing protein n=1 Tax=Escallonia herrerae TaxID=1293975 RepID=A0AA88W118_9ASTE|nr:hypothetical protein RJ639_004730 [Escallonia herrerae]